MSTPPLWAYHGLTALAPWLMHHAARKAHAAQNADPERLGERYGNASLPRPEGPLIWLHAASVGEVQTLAVLAPKLAEAATLLVTTATQTGADRGCASLPKCVLHQFQPIDTPQATSRFLDHWAPDLAVFAEADMAPNMLRALNTRGIPATLVGARASRSRKRWPRTMAALMRRFQLITAANPAVSNEIAALGFDAPLIEDLKAQAPRDAQAPEWALATPERPIWLAASTHPEDEPLVFAAHTQLLQTRPDALLVIAPRHPDKRSVDVPVEFASCRASLAETPQSNTQVFVMDKMGQLPSLHAACPVTFLGGAIGPQGGHSPWEAAAAGSQVLTGPKISNNQGAFDAVPHRVVTTTDELYQAVKDAWQSPRPAPQKPEAGTVTLDALLDLLAKATA